MIRPRTPYPIALPDEPTEGELADAFGPASEDWCPPDAPPRGRPGVLTGRVLRLDRAGVWIDVGAKCPGIVPLREWRDATPPRPGDLVPVLATADDEVTDSVVLSHRQAVRFLRWSRFAADRREGDRVRGTVTRAARGGLIVDVGCEAFLPASQIDVRRVDDPSAFVGHEIECRVLRIDPAKWSVLVSRRPLLECVRPMADPRRLDGFQRGQVRTGVVKNVADFGAFVDLGGIDGLLHVRDMFWGRWGDVRRAVALEQRVEVVLLNVDRDKEKIDLGLPRKLADPGWLTPEVVGLARAVAAEGRTEWLPILADALEDAGCRDPDVLGRLRGGAACEGLVASLSAGSC